MSIVMVSAVAGVYSKCSIKLPTTNSTAVRSSLRYMILNKGGSLSEISVLVLASVLAIV
jgi:hypothetical protein